MEGIKKLNRFIKEFSGIIAAAIVISAAVLAFSGWAKNIVFDDIYDTLYSIKANDLAHIDLYNQYSRQKEDMILDVLIGATSKEEITKKRLDLEVWYNAELLKLSRVPADRKDITD